MVSVNWATKVVTVFQADMTLLSGTLFELDLNAFRLTLKGLEASTVGITFEDIHRHDPPVNVGGVTLARVVEIINGYTITFDDGQYAVDLEGANSNVGDVVNRNQVSYFSKNSAGLIDAADNVAKVKEMWQIMGLDISQPMTVSAVERKTGSNITLVLTDDGTTLTVARQ